MDISSFIKETTNNCILESEVPDICLTEPCCLGIDEAGRGPVLGPMVYGISYCTVKDKDNIIAMGLADSKMLKEEERDSIFEKINTNGDTIGWTVEILSPNYISNSMLRRCKYNLNTISHDTAIGLIRNTLDKGVNLKEVFVDTVGVPEKYQAKLKAIFPQLDITVAKKADSTYPIVGAASICAKVARDKCVKNWHFIENKEYKDYGSGYPSDPVTKKFMADNIDDVFGYPQFVRFSWSTASVILDKSSVRVEWEDDDEEDDLAYNQTTMSNFYASKDKKPDLLKRHIFYQDRNLSQISCME